MKNLFKILILSFLVFSCDEDNPVSDTTSNEVDVDWLLVRTPNYEEEGSPLVSYFFYFTTNSNINNMNLEEGSISCSQNDFYINVSTNLIFLNSDEGILSFTYNNEDFSFDLSDSEYLYECEQEEEMYSIQSEIDEPLQRIIYNEEMGYFTLFGPNGSSGTDLNVLSPNELIDYR